MDTIALLFGRVIRSAGSMAGIQEIRFGLVGALLMTENVVFSSPCRESEQQQCSSDALKSFSPEATILTPLLLLTRLNLQPSS